MAKHDTSIPAHLQNQTALTRTGKLNMKNRKPYRTPDQKKKARETAYKTKGGFFHSAAPVSYHN